MNRKLNKEDIVIDSINYALLICVSFVTLYPFYYIFILSINDGLDASRGGIYFWPRTLSLDNYTTIFSDDSWTRAAMVSVFRTLVGTLLTLLLSGLMAYGLSHQGLIFRKPYFIVLIISMYFSGGLIPQYILLKELHLLDSIWVYILPYLLNPFFVLIMVAFFREIPNELKESAKIDGANDLQIFLKVVVPVSSSVFATVALFVGVFHWNAWLDAAYFIQSAELKTMSYKMMVIINKSMTLSMQNSMEAQAAMGTQTTVTTLSLQMATIMVAVLPILFIYPFLQKYFVKGIMLGSVKG